MKNRNKIIIILSIVFFIVAIAFIILGFALSGANILAWFTSKWAMYFYVFGGVYLLCIAAVFVTDYIKRM